MEINQYYRFKGGGEKVKILAQVDSYYFGKVFLAENRNKKFVPISETETENWQEISKEEWVEHGEFSSAKIGELLPFMIEFQNRFEFKNMRIVYPDKHRFSQVRKIQEERIAIDAIYFKNKIENLELQFQGCLNFCHLFFLDEKPAFELPGDYMIGRIKHLPEDVYLITNNFGFIEFGKKFYMEMLNL